MKGKKIFGKGTFRVKRRAKDQQELHLKAKATLGSGNLRAAVQLPPGEDLNEWLAVNTVDFFNQVGYIYPLLSPSPLREKKADSRCAPPGEPSVRHRDGVLH